MPSNNRVYLDKVPNIRRVPIMATWLEIMDPVNAEILHMLHGGVIVPKAARAASGTAEYFKQNAGDLNSK